MRYVALLRGINVGGKGIVRMADLKALCERCGLRDVRTYIQSGNVIFETEDDPQTVAAVMEGAVLATFGFPSTVVIKSKAQMEAIVAGAPGEWRNAADLRRYVAFVRQPCTPDDVLREAQPREGVDFLTAGEGVVYMSTLLSGLSKSGLTRLAGKEVYGCMSMRNFDTVRKLLQLMADEE